MIASSFGSSEFINCETKANFLNPFRFNNEILFDLIPPIANQGMFKSFVNVLMFSIPKGFLFFFVVVLNTGPIPM